MEKNENIVKIADLKKMAIKGNKKNLFQILENMGIDKTLQFSMEREAIPEKLSPYRTLPEHYGKGKAELSYTEEMWVQFDELVDTLKVEDNYNKLLKALNIFRDRMALNHYHRILFEAVI